MVQDSKLFCVCFGNFFLYKKTSKNAMIHMMSSFKMIGDVISDNFLMLWFQKDSLDTVGFRTFRNFREGGPGFLNKIVDFRGSAM